jgi:GT2 family glycosyltransferase
MNKKKIDIVMLSFAKTKELWQMTQQAIDSLHASEDHIEFDVYVVESNPQVAFADYKGIKKLLKIPEGVSYHYNKYLNFGLEEARKENTDRLVALCSNDIIFFPQWATSIMTAIKETDALSACPLDPTVPEQQGITDIAEGYEIRKHISGWCLVGTPKMFKEIGNYLPAPTEVFHWGSDALYADMLWEKDMKHILVPNSQVRHLSEVTSRRLLSPSEVHEHHWGAFDGYRRWKALKKTPLVAYGRPEAYCFVLENGEIEERDSPI